MTTRYVWRCKALDNANGSYWRFQFVAPHSELLARNIATTRASAEFGHDKLTVTDLVCLERAECQVYNGA